MKILEPQMKQMGQQVHEAPPLPRPGASQRRISTLMSVFYCRTFYDKYLQ